MAKLNECESSGILDSCFAILTDINMPLKSRLEVVEEVGCDEELDEAPVYAYSSSDDIKDICSAKQFQINDYFIKGLDNSQLSPIVDPSQKSLFRRRKRATGSS